MQILEFECLCKPQALQARTLLLKSVAAGGNESLSEREENLIKRLTELQFLGQAHNHSYTGYVPGGLGAFLYCQEGSLLLATMAGLEAAELGAASAAANASASTASGTDEAASSLVAPWLPGLSLLLLNLAR